MLSPLCVILFPVFVDKTLPNFVLVTVETINNEVIFKIACMHYHIFVFGISKNVCYYICANIIFYKKKYACIYSDIFHFRLVASINYEATRLYNKV